MAFSWLHRQRTELSHFKSRKFLPTTAICALAAAFCSVFLTLGIILSLDGKEVWPQDGIYLVVQPASCLSIILSFTSILIKFALDEGVAVTWWVHRLRGANVETLQNIWHIWHWVPNAVANTWDVRNRRYLALPVLFVCLLPFNGFLIQGSILTEPVIWNIPTTIQVPMVPHVDLGFAGGGPNASNWGRGLGTVWQQVVDPASTRMSQYAYFGSRTDGTNQTIDLGYSKTSVYTAKVPGAGFDIQCSEPELSFDLLPTADRPNTRGAIFNSTIRWYPGQPNTLEVNVYWKETYACVGQYNTTRCILRAATVEYPVRIDMNLSGNPYTGPFYSLQRIKYGTFDKTLKILPTDSHEGQNGIWTYAGIQTALSTEVDSTFVVGDNFGNFSGVGSNARYNGRFGQVIAPSGPRASQGGYNCNASYAASFALIDKARYLDSDTIDPGIQRGGTPLGNAEKASPAYLILDRIRQVMFLSSVYIGSQAITDTYAPVFGTNVSHPHDYFVQTVPGTETKIVNLYKTRLDMWGVSVTLTWLGVIVVLPTFWSFWHLPYGKDLSPVEVARAFDAPVFTDFGHEERTSHVLQRVGHQKLPPDESIQIWEQDQPLTFANRIE